MILIGGEGLVQSRSFTICSILISMWNVKYGYYLIYISTKLSLFLNNKYSYYLCSRLPDVFSKICFSFNFPKLWVWDFIWILQSKVNKNEFKKMWISLQCFKMFASLCLVSNYGWYQNAWRILSSKNVWPELLKITNHTTWTLTYKYKLYDLITYIILSSCCMTCFLKSSD